MVTSVHGEIVAARVVSGSGKGIVGDVSDTPNRFGMLIGIIRI